MYYGQKIFSDNHKLLIYYLYYTNSLFKFLQNMKY